VANSHDSLLSVEAPGVSVSLDRRMNVASLRYFDRGGAFAQKVRTTVGPLPERLCAAHGVPEAGEPVILAWRSSTETLLLCADDALLRKLETDVASCRDGCVVVQTGGARVLRASGARVADLFARMGGQSVLPALGGARRSRLAEIAVLAIRVQSDETLLVVERVYAEHLMEWILVSATDLDVS
jgi:sarcosine oxidase gamma subunit